VATDAWGFNVERQLLARRYRNVRLVLSATRLGSVLAVLVWLLTGPTVAIRDFASGLGGNPWVGVAGYVLVLYALLWVLGLPFSAASALFVERRFGLSTEPTGTWLRDEALATALGLGFALVAAEVLWALIRWSAAWWWLVGWGLGLGFQLLIGFFGPVLIAPLFFRFTPLRDEALAKRLQMMAEAQCVPVVGVFEMKASAKTRRSNAALVGIGRTRRIIVTDTLLADFAADEVETVLAHELAHQRHGDSWRGLALGAAIALVGFAVVGVTFPGAAAAIGFASIADIATLPILMLLGTAVSIPLGPLEHAFTRRWEARADGFALGATGKRDAFAAAMVKLHDRNLAVANPHRLVEAMLYSHPSGWRRVEHARAVAPSKPY